MSHSRRLTNSVLALSGTIIVFLIFAAYWVRSVELSELSPLLQVGGNLHPVLLHLPIGVFIFIGLTEIWNFIDRAFVKRFRIKGGLPILAFGTVSAVFAACAGFLLYLQGDYSGELIDRHMYWGTAFAVSTLIVLCSALAFNEDSQVYRFVLFLNIIALSIAAHQGGLITHGDPLEPLFSEEAVEEASPVLRTTYQVVDKILQSKCYECHSVGKKKKGGLLMDSYEALLAGGKKGNALVPGSLLESKMSTYVHLPLEDELHMPPEGKPQLSEMEIRFIDEWILSGASPDALLLNQDLDVELINWAAEYMYRTANSTTILVATPPHDTFDTLEPDVDFDSLTAAIEQHAVNSVTRVGPEGRDLVFSAVNARGTLIDEVLDSLLQAGPYLVELDLANTAMSGQAVEQLIQSAPQLRQLNLSGMPVDTSVMEALSGLDTLESLNLFNADLTADVVPLLSELNTLKTLYVGGTGLSPETVTQIKLALPECEVVADYYLIRHRPKIAEE